MKKLFKLVLSLSLIVTMLFSMNCIYATSDILNEVTDNNYQYFTYDALKDGYQSSRSDILTPSYYIFAGSKDLLTANQLIEELDMIDTVREWGSSIFVINPINENEYGQEDLNYFNNLIKSAPIKNIKIIGIDEGATFVNNYISQKCNYIAGMLIINGKIDSNLANNSAVPVYLSNSSETAINYYKNANQVNDKNDYSDYSLHFSTNAKLQAVAVAKNDESLSTSFSNAWKSIFSQNYRYHNSIGEFYNLPILNDQIDILELQYDLVQTPIFDELNIQYNEMVHQSVSNMPDNNYAWFEYIPKDVLNNEDNSVPLVVSIHGNQNDPRLQGDTTGWVELAAKEKFMVISPEYQTPEENSYFTLNPNIYGSVSGLGANGIINLIKDIQVKYPQIDPSRIYVTGLSQGGAMTSLLGIQNSDIFAGAASVSGVNVFNQQISELTADYTGNEMPYLYLCGDHDWFQMIPVDGSSQLGISANLGLEMWQEGSATDIYPALQAYQKINNLNVTAKNMNLNPYFGISLENQHWTKLGSKDMLEGQLSNDKGVIMQLAAIKDLAHWNYKPEAQYIWNFFKNYQRDINTGKLIYLNNSQSTKPDTETFEPAKPVTSIKTGDNLNYQASMIAAGLALLIIIKNKKIFN